MTEDRLFKITLTAFLAGALLALAGMGIGIEHSQACFRVHGTNCEEYPALAVALFNAGLASLGITVFGILALIWKTP